MHTCIKFLNEGYHVIGLDNINNYYSTKLKNDRIKNILNESKLLKNNFTFLEEDLNSTVWSDLNKGIDEFINWYKLYYENFNN